MRYHRVKKSMIALISTGLFGLIGPTSAHAAPSCTVTTTVKRGSNSADVKCLETRLTELGYKLVGPDNLFGRSTDTAVRAYQKTNKLTVDGIVGKQTSTSLGIRGAMPAPQPVETVPPTVIESRTIGTSVGGRPILATRLGTKGGRVVLVIGVIHGDENKGALITKALAATPVPKGVDLWLIDTINPDGVADNQRTNANDVDLNRNFEAGWEYIAPSTTHHQYSGEKAADQPETQAVQDFIAAIKPALTIWYHQDLNTIGGSSSTAKKYAELAGMTTSSVGCTTKCTGTAGAYVKAAVPGSTSLLVELPASSKVTSAMIARHVTAVLGVAPAS